MNVCFFRHGPAVEPGTQGVTEEGRPLTDEGRRKTRQAARGLKRLKLGIDAVISSPLARALETAEILAEVLGLERPKVSDRLVPEVTPAHLLEILNETQGNCPVLVGHEPSLSGAISQFVSNSGSFSLELKKAGMAFAKLKTLAPRPRGTLLLFLSPGTLRKLAR